MNKQMKFILCITLIAASFLFGCAYEKEITVAASVTTSIVKPITPSVAPSVIAADTTPKPRETPFPDEASLPKVTPFPGYSGPLSFPHEEVSASRYVKQSDIAYISNKGDTVKERFLLPKGFKRVETKKDSFSRYLQNLPLLPAGAPLVVYDKKVRDDNHHAAVFDMDVGKFNLQQCADAVLRFRCEYLYSQNRYDEIRFSVSAKTAFPFVIWANGYSLKEDKNGKLYWRKDDENDASPLSFRHYLNRLHTYAGTSSLYDDTKKVAPDDIAIGDVFVITETPESAGHAVIIVDMAKNADGEKICLIAEGHTPAQSVHITKNLVDKSMGAWFKLNPKGELTLKTATFTLENARRFK